MNESRRKFVAGSLTGMAGVAVGFAFRGREGGAVRSRTREGDLGSLAVARAGPGRSAGARPRDGVLVLRVAETLPLEVRFSPRATLPSGARLWLFYEPRQGATAPQTDVAGEPGYVRAEVAGNPEGVVCVASGPRGNPRTLDLYPAAPEFLHVVHLELRRPLAVGRALHLVIAPWQGPDAPIDPFRFWMVVDAEGAWDFGPTGFRTYHAFTRRRDGARVEHAELAARMLTASLSVEGAHRPLPSSATRRTPGIFWGELHGMAFNQRPLDDFYDYARRVAQLDFCCPCLFSYNTCVGDVWDEVKSAALRHTEPGRFVGLAGFECGTPPDDSHRCVVFRDATAVPPILCEARPPAGEEVFRRRLHPDTIVCDDLDQFYATVEHFSGLVTGHHHTLAYRHERLAELWQKQRVAGDGEEERIMALLREGHRMGFTGGSDTHDSRPGNPYPESHCPAPAGCLGVMLAETELTREALWDALRARRTIATTGARIALRFTCDGAPPGSELPAGRARRFEIEIDGTDRLERVELLRQGVPRKTWAPDGSTFSATIEEPEIGFPGFYLVRCRQADGHTGWTSPIWIG